MMPDMDGPTAIRALRLIDPGVKIIATSGMAEAGGNGGPPPVDADVFLLKPCTPESLLGKLREVLAR
jgi:two-component system, cell cycle sensor histidine kinase and response regulator CckA